MDPNEQLLDAIIARMATRVKAAGSTPSGNPAHGPGGLLGNFGMPADIVNAMVVPLTGLAERLPVKLSNFVNPIFTILTGQTASTGTEPTTACADGRQPGNLKTCSQTWPFGRIVMDSQVIQADRAGELINRGEFIDQSLIGNPFAEVGGPVMANPRDALRSLTKKKILELMVDLYRDYGHLIYDANPANTSGSEGYIEFNGLDRLINDNYQDAYTGNVCPAANSLVQSFNALVTADGTATLTAFTEIYRHQRYLAERTHLLPVKFVWVMRYSLFMQLTALWPCAYQTYRCQTAGTVDAQVVIDGREQETQRAAMRAGRYLLIDDEKVEVIIDDFIAETAVGGTFTSDVYLVPLTYAGSRPALYWEYFNLAGPFGMQEAINDFGGQGSFKILGGGRFWLHNKPPTNECLQIRIGYKPRLILEVPFLAARLTDVKYTATLHERSGDPSDPYYYVNGGVYSQPEPTFYPPFDEA